MFAKRMLLTPILAISLVNGGCATTSGGKTAVEIATRNCMFAIGGATILGAVVGNNVGDGNAKKGALIGAVAGAGVCGFLLKEASARDKARIRELQVAALNKEEYGLSRDTFVADNGKTIIVQTVTSQAKMTDKPIPQAMVTKATEVTQVADAGSTSTGKPVLEWTDCRDSQTSIGVAGGGMETLGATYECRTSLGDWVPV